ncbi:malyl-CoA thiolesterase [Brevundimonas sp. Leaf363]|uniref:HpcH/HpaI aldolase/citrate lyase family protein n=1 Tax=Brevundimonas sp. Leaf363 TaxID=1736353 RepID=UPI0006FF143F|nr:CoA ester lyase [Brevundimonas sp. Leaf363]KQS55572.1 malyl-CoA thiolesterase [Brevundimonas sp. Leaf363]
MNLFRSVLFLPADNARAVQKARGLDCDVAVLDLEDAVGPDHKAAARAAAVEAVRQGGFRPRLAVRVNAADTPWAADDLVALAETGVDLVVLPKVEKPETVADAARALGGRAALVAMIETPLALKNLWAIAEAGGRLEALMLGVNDLAATLNTASSPDREPLKPWLAAVVAAARLNGLTAIDGVFNRLDDPECLAAECAQGRLYGFDGKSLIHPNQIAAAHAAFAPSEAAIAHARAVVAAFTENPTAGVLTIDGQMTERLHLEAAQRLLASLSQRERA